MAYDGVVADDGVVTDPSSDLRSRILPERFEVLHDPLGWRCRSCRAEVSTPVEPSNDPSSIAAVARLSESAADHAMHCGRCND